MADAEKLSFQIFFSDTLVEVMFLMSGYVTLQILYKVIISSDPNFRHSASLAGHLIRDKWIKLLPLVSALISLEFIWPLLASGPLYKEGSEFILTNCHNHFWNNFLLIANWFPAIEKCSPQLFYSCVDFQLNILLIFTVTVFKYRKRLALILIFVFIGLSFTITAFVASIHDVTPNFVARNSDLDDRMKFMDWIHYPTYSHLPAYFIGALIALKSATKTRIEISSKTNQFLRLLSYLLSLLALLSPALHNTFNILPKNLVPLYIVLQKFFYVFSLFPVLLPLKQGRRDLDENNNQNVSSGQRVSRREGRREGRVRYSFMTCLYRLTFSIYLVNYYCIRFDFLTSRNLFEPGLYHAVSS